MCRKCFLILPETKEYFYRTYNKKYNKYYFRPYCKECMKDAQITNYDKHRGDILDKRKEKYRREKAALPKP